MKRGERQIELLAAQCALQHQIRAIESVHRAIHEVLLDWGTWSAERYPGKPLLTPPSIWSLPGEPRTWDEDDEAPEAEAGEAPLREREVIVADEKINDPKLPSTWRRVVLVNYQLVPWTQRTAPLEQQKQEPVLDRVIEWDRPNRARMGHQNYLDQLHRVLEHLG